MSTFARTLAVLACGGFPAAWAQLPSPDCGPLSDDLSAARRLRALSLDLRGVVPTPGEYGRLVDGEVPEALLDEWLASEAFVQRAVRLHRDLFWNNVTNVNLLNNRSILRREAGGGRFWRFAIADLYRGDRVVCLDEPASFGPGGEILTELQPDGTRREGWVTVEPYWAPGTSVQVCAFDAQAATVSPLGTRCDTADGLADPQCGCGPRLSFCAWGATTLGPLMRAMGEDLDRRVAAIVREDRPYVELFEGDAMYVNGPLVHFWKYQAELPGQIRLLPRPVEVDKLPDLEFTDTETWVRIEAGPAHAGVLTAPAYLLRFQTNRARANRFYNSFLCQPFVAPDGGLPAASGDITLDLQQRDGCKYCHGLLEPAAAYWGRWAASGGGYLDPERYPAMRDDCRRCATGGEACSDDCRRHYVTSALTAEEDPYLGWLRPYEFLRDDHMAHVEMGPSVLVARTVVDGRFGACTTRTQARALLGREPTEDEQGFVDETVARFAASGYRYRDLVKAVVTSAPYRRVR
jgi:hypothetical protein